MDEPEQNVKRRRGKWGSLGIAAVAGASAVTLILPSAVGHAEPLAQRGKLPASPGSRPSPQTKSKTVRTTPGSAPSAVTRRCAASERKGCRGGKRSRSPARSAMNWHRR